MKDIFDEALEMSEASILAQADFLTFTEYVREGITRLFEDMADKAGRENILVSLLQIYQAQTYMLNAWKRYLSGIDGG